MSGIANIVRLELIDLLVTGEMGTYQETFLQKIQSILNRMPKIGTASKAEFLSCKMIGTFIALPYTKLMERLHIQKIYIYTPNPGKQGLLTVKVALQLETNGKKALRLYTFAATKGINNPQHWNTDDLADLISQLRITKDSLPGYKVNEELQVSGKIYQFSPNFDRSITLEERDIVILTEDQSGGLTGIFQRLVQRGYPLSNTKRFKEVMRTVSLKDAEGIDIENLESLFNELPKYYANSEKIDNAHENMLESVAEQVKEAASNIIKQGLYPIYKYWKKQLHLSRHEISSHGYVVGILENLFKYRYALDIGVEKNLGKGRADLTFVSRLDELTNKNWNGIPVCIEFKAGNHSPQEGLDQINQQGYLHITPRTRTLARWGVGLGVNLHLDSGNPVQSKTIEIKVNPINFIETLLNLDALVTSSQTSREDIIKNGLRDVDCSIIRQNGALDNSEYFKNFLLGQAMGFTESGYSTYALFERLNPNLSLFFVKENGVVVLNINKPFTQSDSDPATHSDCDVKAAFLREKRLLQENSPYFAVTVEVNFKSTPNLISSASGIFDPLASTQKNFLFKEIRPFNFIQENSLSYQEAANELVDFLDKGFTVMESESDMQALWQGGLLASGKVQVYTESNHVLGKRADLVILPIEGEANVKVVELKYTRTSNQAEELQERAKVQVSDLKYNMKSFTDKGKLDLVAMTYDAEEKLFLYEQLSEDIEHSSQGEKSPRKSIDSDSPIKRKSQEIDSASDSEETRKEEKKKSSVSDLGEILGGIAAALGTILFAGVATTISALKKAARDILSATTSVRNLLNSELDITPRELEGVERFANEIIRSSTTSEARRKTMEQYKRKFENLSKRYQERSDKVDRKMQEKTGRRQRERARNRKKLAYEQPGPSRRKRSVLSPIPEEDELLAERMMSYDGDNCTSSGIVRETIPNKLFSLCRIQLEEDGHGSQESGTERIELDCYLEIDYQNKDSVLVDASLWDLANKTIRHEDGVVSLSLPLLKEGEKRLALANASRVYYEFIDTHANIFTLPLNRTQTCFQTNRTEPSTEELEEETLTTPVNLLEIEEEENSQIKITNCSRIELSTSHNESYVEGDCVINPTLNSIDVIEINPSPDQDPDWFTEFSGWNLLQNAIEYSEANNTLAITVEDSDAIGIRPFQVKLRNYLHRERNLTSYKLSDKVFDEVVSVFTQRNDEVLQQQRSDIRITSFHIKTSIPKTVFNQKGDKASNVLTWYKNITQAEAGIEVLYGEVVNPKISDTIWIEKHIRHHGKVMVRVRVNPKNSLRGFGSKFNDKIWVYDDFMYVYGGEGKDCYIVEPNRSGGIKTTFINNDAEDELQDYLVLPVPLRALAIALFQNNSIQFFSTQREFARKMVLANYCKDSNKQHLAVLTNDGCLIGLPNCELLAETPQRISRLFGGHVTASAEICNTTMEEICNETTERNNRNPIRTKRAVNDRIKVEKQDERINKQRKAHRIFKPVMEQSPLRPSGMSCDEQVPRIEAKRATEKSSNVHPRYGVTAYENMSFIKWLSYLFGRRSFIERMNKAEQASSLYENDQDNSLYWAEKSLKEGIVLYDADKEE